MKRRVSTAVHKSTPFELRTLTALPCGCVVADYWARVSWMLRCFRSKPRASTAFSRAIGLRTLSVWANAVSWIRSSWTI